MVETRPAWMVLFGEPQQESTRLPGRCNGGVIKLFRYGASIPKKNGKCRPLGIPAMSCRAMQALHLRALDPIAETLADPNSYGFRPKRSTADAIGQCFNALSGKHSAEWIFEGDISLELSEEKTRITHIEEGFDFLGFDVRKYAGKMFIKPSKVAVKRFLNDVRGLIKAGGTDKTEQLIRQLNLKLRGWANYYRRVVAKRTFSYVDTQVFRALWAWIKRRHPQKSVLWRKNRYFRHIRLRQWVFFARVRDKFGQVVYLDLVSTANVPVRPVR